MDLDPTGQCPLSFRDFVLLSIGVVMRTPDAEFADIHASHARSSAASTTQLSTQLINI